MNTQVNALKKRHKELNPQNERDFLTAQLEVIEDLSHSIDLIKRSLNTETACKNQAFYFILANDLLEDFKQYARENPL